MLPTRNVLMPAGLGALLTTVVLFAGAPAATAEPETSSPFATDALGFVDSKARCDETQNAAVFARTQRSLVVICADSDGGYEYRGVRVSDGAALQATAERTDAGFEASTDGAVYTVSPTELVVTSAGKIIYRDTWIDYLQAR